MAKRKGKSQHRMNWQQQYEHGEEDRQQFSARSRLTQRQVKLPSQRNPAELENIESLPRANGMVVGLYPGGVAVRAEGTNVPLASRRVLFCGVAKAFRVPGGAEHASAVAVGDLVTVALTRREHAQGQEADKSRTDGLILLRQKRRSALSRPEPRSEKRRDEYKTEFLEKVIVANVDVLLIVAASVQPPLRQGLIDRFLIIAERGGLTPVLAINKVDLGTPDEAVLADLAELGLSMWLMSAATGEGVEPLREALAGKNTVLAGQSGVGKSTLVNALVPGAQAATREIRMKDQRGRHRTTSASVYDLPGGGLLVDTPGVRELGVFLRASELPWYFPEFEPLAASCKFRDCTHTHEPQCAVRFAVEEGGILPRRYESYLRILATLETS
ncbi:MAG: ribosome small subunit-dependent GTPase A [Phycisphaerae bacterium]|nr:ribosome small subunit-dependent GTPase A [Phycisphaerae bacterium]